MDHLADAWNVKKYLKCKKSNVEGHTASACVAPVQTRTVHPLWPIDIIGESKFVLKHDGLSNKSVGGILN